MRKLMAIATVCFLTMGLFVGCGDSDSKSTNDIDTKISEEAESDNEDIEENDEEGDISQTEETEFSKSDADMFTDRDVNIDYDEDGSIKIELNGKSATASEDSVKISGSVITITEEKTHIISGELDDGMIIIDASENAKIQLVLEDANINSNSSAALFVKEADKVFVTLGDGTENYISNGGSFEESEETAGNNIDAPLFSKQDLTLNGSGKLVITSPAGHGIVCKDDLVITSGDYEITSASHGINANDSVRIKEADILLDAGKDGIHAENSEDSSLGFIYVSSGTIKVEAEGDGISSESYMQIQDGVFDILSGGGSENGEKKSSDNWGNMGGGMGRPNSRTTTPNTTTETTTDTSSESSSMKGIKSNNSMLIAGGSIKINSADDAIHSNISAIIKGGEFEIASGDDAIHAEEKLTVLAGNINISESYEGLEALDIDIEGGDIKLVASDDGLNAAGGTDSSGTTGGRDGMFGGGHGGPGGMSGNSDGSITISGGTLYINSSGDGIDANGTLEISDGQITVVGPTQGDTATLDYDVSGIITGGTFIGTGASNMAQTFSSSEQGVISVNAQNQAAGTKIVLKDEDGNVIVEYSPELSYQIVIISTPDLKTNETYILEIGEESAEVQAS